MKSSSFGATNDISKKYQAGPSVKSKFTELKAYYSRGLSEEEMILYGLRNNGATVAAGKSVEGGVIGDDGRFYTNELSDEFKRLEYKTFISEKAENKILRGELNSKKRIIGGHSSEINGVTTEYLLEETVKINSDGTASKIKTSTLFPETWSDADIINSVKQIGDTPAIGIRMEDKATIHLGRVNNVEIVVIKIGG